MNNPPSIFSTHLTDRDRETIRGHFRKKRRIVILVMAVLILVGLSFSGVELSRLNGTISGLDVNELLEALLPLIIALIFCAVGLLSIYSYSQKRKHEIRSNRKKIYKGVVTNLRQEQSTPIPITDADRVGYRIDLGEVSLDHEELYYELKEGDEIEVHISDNLQLILFKNIKRL